MAATDLVLEGLWYAPGRSVSVAIAGLDCGDYTVSSSGLVTVPIGSDPDGLLSGAYLVQFDVGPWDRTTYGDATTELTVFDGFGEATIYVPVVIGYVYPTVGVSLRPQTEQQLKGPTGPGLGKSRRVHMFAALLQNTVGVYWGTNLANLKQMIIRDSGRNPMTKDNMITAVYQDVINDSEDFDGSVSWSVTRPYPCMVRALATFVESQER